MVRQQEEPNPQHQTQETEVPTPATAHQHLRQTDRGRDQGRSQELHSPHGRAVLHGYHETLWGGAAVFYQLVSSSRHYQLRCSLSQLGGATNCSSSTQY